MQKTLPIARQKLLELLRLTPEPHRREGYVAVFLNAADDYAHAILHDVDATHHCTVNRTGRGEADSRTKLTTNLTTRAVASRSRCDVNRLPGRGEQSARHPRG